MKTSRSEKKKQNILPGLIPSQIKIRILDVLFSNPGREFYYREFVDKIGTKQRGTIARELNNLEKSEYIQRRVSGNRKYYRINKDNPIYPELKSIWMKTVGIFAQLEERLSSLQQTIDFAFVYGSFASGSEQAGSDIDLMIIGKVKSTEVSKHLTDMGVNLGREINYSVFPIGEVIERLKRSDHFWTRLFEDEKVFLIGDPNEFGGLGK